MSGKIITWLTEHYKPIPVSIALISVAVTFLNYLFFQINNTLIFDPLFLIPILLVAYYYPKKGLFTAFMFAMLYLVMVLLIFNHSVETLIAGLEHAGIFIIVGFVAAYLSNRSPQELRGYQELASIIEPFRMRVLILPSLIITITAGIFFLNFLIIQANDSVIFDPLFYFPIILIAYFYPQRGVVATTGIAVLYLAMVMIVPHQSSEIVLTSIGHAAFFIIIGFVLSFLSFSFSREHAIHERLAELVSSSGDAIIGVTTDGIITDWNRGAQQMFQYPAPEILNRPIAALMGEDQMDAFSGILGKIGSGIALQTLETEWKNKNGKAILVSLSISPIQNSRGIFIGASVIARDITERKRAEEALRISKQRLTDIIEHLPDATFAIDKDGIVIAWNKGMEEMTGVRAPDILNTGNYSYAIPFYGTRRPVFVDLLIHEDKVLEKMYPYIDRKDKKITSENFIPALNGGKGAYLWIFASPLFDSSGNVIGAIETIRDITDRKNIENSLEQANRKIHLLNSITRHDILNQIMALNICLDMSREAVADPAVRSLLQQARRASENINDQISFTKEYQDIGIKSPEWQDVRETFIKAAASLNTGHIVIQPCERDLEVYADPLFEKVFYNLIDNSLKYGERLTRIRCAWKDEQERLLIIYEDDGVGIPVEDKKKIFRKGFGKHSGLGLFLIGEILAITRMTIAETGEPGKGARFEISVPSGSFRFRDR